MPASPAEDLPLERKAALVAGASTWSSVSEPGIVDELTLSDGPHGVRRQDTSGDALGIGDSLPAVCFPPAVGLGSTWNTALAERVGVALGGEARRLDVQVILGPGMNIKRSPLGGRNFEYFSEDPHVTGHMAAAMVRGIQSQGVAATPKHFAVNNQETDRMRVSATVSDRALREIYLNAFEHVVREASPWALMSAYNKINGVFASEDRWLLEDLLRTEWGFDGLVMSDWGAVDDTALAVGAGLDLEMPPSGRSARIVSAVESGELGESLLDVSIARLQRLAERTLTPAPAAEVDPEEVALDAAREAIVLLKNDGVLPLTPSAKVLVVGEFALTPRFQGGGSSRVNPTRTTNALDCLTELAGETMSVVFEPGFVPIGDSDAALADAAVAAASDADVIVAFLGLSSRAESEGFDRTSLSLPADQLALLERLSSTGKKVVVVLSNGGVVSVSPWRDAVSGIIEGWLLGQEGGRALAEVLLGITNPSGRLTETIPLALSDTPSSLTFPGRDGQVLYGEDVFVGYRAYDTQNTPVAYPFGFGLSYTTFTYDALSVRAGHDGTWDVTVTVRNSGSTAGAEVVQVYVGPAEAAPDRPVHELRGFTKVFLDAGESQTVTQTLTMRDFSLWNARFDRWQVTPGAYRVEVGSSSRDLPLATTIDHPGDGVVDTLRLDSTLGEWATNPISAPLVAKMRAAIPESVADAAPELAAMVQSTPVMKLTTWNVGLTEEIVRGVVASAQAAAEENAR